jgi:curved DNA-binding protein
MDGQPVEYEAEITLEEAFSGTQRTLQFSSANGQPRTINVKIPAGVDNGSRVRMAGEGAPGVGGGKRGDLFLIIRVAPSDRFERRGDDLYTEVPVDLYTMVLGGEVRVPTLKGGQLLLRIPAETQNGKQFRLAGKGMPKLNEPNSFGDLYVKSRVVLPEKLGEKELKLYRELANLRDAR